MHNLNSVAISGYSQKIINNLLSEQPKVSKIYQRSKTYEDFERHLSEWAKEILQESEVGLAYYKEEKTGQTVFNRLRWQDFAAIRVLDYIDNTDREFEDKNLHGLKILNEPFRILYLGIRHGTGGGKPAFFQDMTELFNQLNSNNENQKPKRQTIESWMDRHPSGLDKEIIEMRKENRDRIINILIDKIEKGKIQDRKFNFQNPEASRSEKFKTALKWWDDRVFHLRFAFRSPELINEMLGYSLTPETMDTLMEAREAGIPFFVNPYYLSLLNTRKIDGYIASDQAIRDYIIYSRELIEEFGHIHAWEKEDEVEPGKPNAAGWILPEGHNIHRRYPEVAILIPDSMGRACGGLCTSCQRMYDFQSGHLNFDLDRLKPRETWPKKLERLMKYFEEDTQLRDILITGGDALMSSNRSLKRILDAVYDMAVRKKEINKELPDGKKVAEMVRVRLGTRLPIYLPQRITNTLAEMLREFKEKASRIGIKQFVIQTHYESAMEITPESAEGIQKLRDAGWTVTNQQVFTAASSRRGHTAKLRKELNRIGVLPYYTFTVKGYRENSHNFTNTARSIQERIEEKALGEIPEKEYETIHKFPEHAENMINNIDKLKKNYNLPFLATDRNVLNLPGVGKSNTFRTIGITHDGRRILEFDHDGTRRHSPIINKLGRMPIVESKAITDYINQMQKIGEDVSEYSNVYGYSIGETEVRMPIYEYPQYDFQITEEMSNLEV
ncbi:MAG: KamA family protein [Bacteroidales bacterium]|nr:KamA family protein [Bacteroidales bacterium]MCF8328120.1 KamA family protein [Bacteroidales bacterium]